jgi:hypothetical protein
MTKITNTGVCEITCANCPLSEKNNGKGRLCVDYEMHHPEEAISIVQQWSDEHPQRTYLSELLTHFPKVKLDDKGTPKCVCPHHLGLNEIEDCGGTDNYCAECWNQPIPIAESEVEE